MAQAYIMTNTNELLPLVLYRRNCMACRGSYPDDYGRGMPASPCQKVVKLSYLVKHPFGASSSFLHLPVTLQ